MQQLSQLPSLWWGLLLFPLLGLSLKRPLWLVSVAFVAGVVWVSFRAGLILDENLARDLEGQDLIVEGRIADIPQSVEYGLRIVMEVSHAEHEDREVSVPPRILLTSRYSAFRPIAGETWRLPVRLKRPHGYQNPGGFDYESYLFRNRIRAKGYVRDEGNLRQRIADSTWHDIDRGRQALGDRIRAQLPDHAAAGVVVALANGDNRGLTRDQWQVLRRTGTIHLVAISGLHISLIAGIVFFIARRLWALPGNTVSWVPAPMVGAVAAMLAGGGYAALAGFVIPTQRALIMLAVALSGVLLRRRFPSSFLLALALIAVLLYDPLSVLASGFWLSFAAVAVILLVIQGGRSKRPIIYRLSYIQWAIGLGLLPLMLLIFQRVSPVAPVANMLAVPVFELLVVPLTLSGVLLLGLFSDSIAGLFFKLAAELLALLWKPLVMLADAPLSQWVQPVPNGWTLLAGIVGVVWLLAPRGWPARWVGVVWMTPLFLVRPPAPGPGEMWFTLLDVGQGLAAVVRTQSHALVFDAGPRYGSFDTGAAVVEPYLRVAGVNQLDTLVISHGDNDHLGGADSIRQMLSVGETLGSVPLDMAGVKPCLSGQAWHWDGVDFLVMNPRVPGASRANNDSCVLAVRSRYGSVLLPGDIEAATEQKMVAQWGEMLQADILVAPHHGSKTSSTPVFVEAVSPRFVLFPIGYRNRYHHPHPTVVQRYAAKGIGLHDSATSGALEFRLGKGGLALAAFREQHRRYWYTD